MERLVAVARAVNAIPMVVSCEEHDLAVAAISHLPHIVASSLVNLVRDSDDSRETMKQIAAGGFKDITRIASASPEMWEQICMTNTDKHRPDAGAVHRLPAGDPGRLKRSGRGGHPPALCQLPGVPAIPSPTGAGAPSSRSTPSPWTSWTRWDPSPPCR